MRSMENPRRARTTVVATLLSCWLAACGASEEGSVTAQLASEDEPMDVQGSSDTSSLTGAEGSTDAIGGGEGEHLLDTASDLGALSQALTAGDTFIFVNENSGLCLGVDGASLDAGARVQQFECDRSRNQTWRVSRDVFISGLRPLVNVKSNLCLGVSGGGAASGADLMQFPCDGRANQQWRPEDRPDATFRFSNGNNRCMGVDGASRSKGAQIKQFVCDERVNQRWSVRSN